MNAIDLINAYEIFHSHGIDLRQLLHRKEDVNIQETGVETNRTKGDALLGSTTSHIQFLSQVVQLRKPAVTNARSEDRVTNVSKFGAYEGITSKSHANVADACMFTKLQSIPVEVGWQWKFKTLKRS